MKFNKTDNKIVIIDYWKFRTVDMKYELYGKPAGMKNAVLMGIYNSDIDANDAIDNILDGFDNTYTYMKYTSN